MHLPLPRVSTAAWLSAALAVMLTAAGCGEPPQKELDQAQAAIEVAVSAGAERFAGESLTGARTALMQARDAVNQRDYKLALSHALDSREKAQAAARAAADARSVLREQLERALTAAAARLERARGVLEDGRAGLTRARLRRARATEAKLTATLQEARAAFDRGDYPAAKTAASEVSQELIKIRRTLEAAMPPAGKRAR
jgi:hypothetical protein